VVMAKKYRPSDDFGEGITPPITTPSEFPPESPTPIGNTGTPPGGESADANSPGIR